MAKTERSERPYMTLPVAFSDSGRDRDCARDLARGKACIMGATQRSLCVGLFSSWSGEKEQHSLSSVEASGKKTTLGGRRRECCSR